VEELKAARIGLGSENKKKKKGKEKRKKEDELREVCRGNGRPTK
jgi:hypothetical protein